jgi:hypothetical protein
MSDKIISDSPNWWSRLQPTNYQTWGGRLKPDAVHLAVHSSLIYTVSGFSLLHPAKYLITEGYTEFPFALPGSEVHALLHIAFRCLPG